MRPLRLSLFLLLAAFARLSLAAGQAAEQPVEIIEAVPVPPETAPGSLVTCALFVSNRNSEEQAMTLVVQAPEGWTVIGGTAELSLELKSGDTVLVSYRVPSAAPAGAYAVTVMVRGTESGTTLGSIELPVQVSTVEALALEHIEAPDYVLAGEVYQARFLLANSGNTPVEALVAARSSPSFEMTVDTEEADLEPGATKVVTVTVRTPEALSTGLRHYLYLTARVAGGTGSAAPHASCGVDVLPRVTGSTHLYDLLPLTLSVVQALEHGGVDSYAFLGTVAAEGPLSTSGDDRFSLYVSARFDPKGAFFPERPELRISYENPWLSLFGGRKFFALSSLTEHSISGSGVEASVLTQPFGVGAYHLLTDTTSATETQTAGYVSYTDPSGSLLRLNLLDNSGIPTPGAEATILSGEMVWRHTSGAVIQGEVAAAGRSGGEAVRLGIAGTNPGLSYQIGLSRASPGYVGPIQDREEVSASLAFSVADSVRVSSLATRVRMNLDAAVPSVSDVASASLSWSIDASSSVVVSHQRVSFDDSVADPQETDAGIDEVTRLSFSRALGNAKVTLSTEISTHRAAPAWAVTASDRYRAAVSYTPDPTWPLAVAVAAQQEGMEMTVETGWHPSSATQLSLAYRAVERHKSFYPGRDSLRLDVSHQFAAGPTISAQGSYSPDRALRRPTDFSLQAGITVPLGLPLRRRAVGRIVGTVTDAESGVGVPDVILRVGSRTAITDLRGTFVFPDLSPGTTYVGVDTARVREDRLVAQRLPIAVEVQASKDSRLDLALVSPASISGTVRLYRTAEDGSLVPADPIPDLIVEIRRNGDLYKTLTGRDGSFSFSRLPPGRWRVRFSSTTLPRYTAFAENDIDFDLRAGESATVDARVLPVHREMKIVDEGEIIEEVPPAGAREP